MVSEEEDVKSSIRIILSTIPGQRIMLPNFGCNLQKKLFDPLTPSNIALMEKIVREALVFHEPRIIVEDIITTTMEGTIELDIYFLVITTNTRYNLVYPYAFKEATNVTTDV